MRQKTFYGIYRRFLAGLLCFCMVMSTVSGAFVITALAEGSESGTGGSNIGYTQHIVADSRVADPDTMDDYLNRLLTQANGSRYAGRVWTDKTVFAYGDSDRAAGSHFNGKDTITLNMGTDGYNGNVTFNADFAHVFSALSSSQVVNEYPPSPVDLVIVFDMSGSMGQDTRYGIDTGLNTYMPHDEKGDSKEYTWPEAGVPMADRIANSRIQKTLDAINNTIDTLMKQNPQNRVAVCGYGANAVVLMPLGHYKKVNESTPYLSVGGMETLYHPSDLVYRVADDTVGDIKVEKSGWYWQNNRDTCYTVVVNAEYNTYTGILDDDGDGSDVTDTSKVETDKWTPITKTVSNNVLSDDGTPVKAFPGDWDANGNPTGKYAKENKEVYVCTKSNDSEYATGLQGVINCMKDGKPLMDEELGTPTSKLKLAMKPTSGLTADDYVGYFTNTQGGIYLAYKQLADSTATTYTETLTNGVVSTVARIPAAIIMSDGGANFSFNEMGDGDSSHEYTAEDWNARYGQRVWENGALQLNYLKANAWTNDHTPKWIEQNGQTADKSRNLTDGRPIDVEHLLGGTIDPGQEIQQKGDEWYNVFIPGKDTLGEEWDGLHGIYNQGADIYEDGTLSSPPVWDQPGVFYSSDNDVTGTAGTVMEVLLTASYMSHVVETHYLNGWTKNNATEGSKSELFTYTMNVDTEHVPLWGRMRLYPTLDPKEYNLNNIDEWYDDPKNNDKFGTYEQIQSSVYYEELKEKITKELLFKGGTINGTKTELNNPDDPEQGTKEVPKTYDITGLKQAWEAFQEGNRTEGPNQINGNGAPVNIAIQPIPTGGVTYKAGDGDNIKVENDDVIANIAYNDGFYDVTTADLSNTFDEILTLILGKVFVPVSGDNDAGVGDSITYQDPIGEYMEIKNGSITATPYHKGESEPNTATDFDMALLLFGEMHGLNRAGVYDYHWNDAWMEANKKGAGKEAFVEGWYLGDATSATSGGKGSVPTGDGIHFDTPTAARAAGWVYRLNFNTAAQYVPILGDIESPANIPEQMKNTVYTIYQFATSTSGNEANEVKRNPIYGEVPQEIAVGWKSASQADKAKWEAENPGLYQLNDIRVWVEDTGDFVDQDGAITPNSGYDRSLYVNIPAAAIPTELATITLGRDGVLSYETNLGSDHPENSQITVEENGVKKTISVTKEMYKNYCAQSTPLRLFYAVGLEEDLILRDEDGNETGVDFNAISPEYISSHTVAGQDYVWFISNFYSATRYGDYATDDASHTRGDPTVTFSPSADNRYYVFQKPLPLYAHAYRVQADGSLKPVDGEPEGGWPADKSGNGESTWESGEKGGASWSGGQYMGTYENKGAFMTAKNSVEGGKITDSSKIKYEYVENGIVFLQDDLLDHVTSNSDGTGYEKDSISFSSEDYFFLLVEYYLPEKDTVGEDEFHEQIPGTQKGSMVQYALARKGSEFGSGYASDNISNGDMLCWTDTENNLNVEFAYVSRNDTGDNTRGEPTLEKLTTTDENALKECLRKCGIEDEKVLADQVKYWLEMQQDPLVQAALKAAEGGDNNLSETDFNKYFTFAVAARPGGIRSGDMSSNLQYKGTTYNSATQLYDKNVTQTSNTYYLPTVSDHSGTNNNVIINNYLGNNGRLEIANQMLHVTKLLSAPAGYTLTDDQKNQTFNYQIFVQGVTGTRTAVKTEYNEYSGNWERMLASIDVLTDNSDLVLTTDNTRALFVWDESTNTAKQVVQNGDEYYFAKEDGSMDDQKQVTDPTLYYLYLPSNGTGTETQHVRRLYQSKGYTGDDKDAFNLTNNGTELIQENGTYPAGTRTYWAKDAELIPVNEVQKAEGLLNTEPGISPASFGTESLKMWTHENHVTEHGSAHKCLTYHTFLIRRPNDETSDTNFTSPFNTRSQYITVELNFGKNANEDGGTAAGQPLTAGDLYDTIIPSGDRPDLFGGLKAEDIAKSTAEFTLKHGEGLLLTGLENRVAYRFTEKLTQEQLNKGYTLQEISHVQQRGSESVYKPGKQEIPIWTKEGATYGEKYPGASNYKTENGLTWAGNPGATMTEEPFAHTNAVMWEYYATMANGASGNHHQPEGTTAEVEQTIQVWTGEKANEYKTVSTPHTVSNNPNCENCDKKLDDGSILHYMYREGKLVDPHYEGEASTYLRNMARYGVSPTVHFAVNNEPNQATVPAESNTDYTGVYSVFGNTGWFEEQVNFINTFEPGQISVTKELKAAEGTTINDTDKATEFSFTLKIDTEGKGVGLSNGVYNYTITGGNSGRLVPHGYEKAQLNDIVAGTDGIWSFTLKGGQTMTVTGLPVDSGYEYKVSETTKGGYTVTDSGNTSGTVEAGSGAPVNVTFTNTKSTPKPVSVDLKLQKTVTGDFTWTDQIFTFLVTPDASNPEGDPVVGHNEVKVTSDTPVNVFENLKFEKPGTYKYTISEQPSDIPGISTDGKTYTVVVVVTEKYNGSLYTGQLEAEVKVNGAAQASPVVLTFNNTYDKDKISVPFSAKKILEGGTLEAEQFSFELKEGDTVLKTATNDAQGNVSFGSVEFTNLGTYIYTIKELPGKDSSIKYDATVYTVTVEITQESGALKSTVTYDSEVTGIPTFTNKVEGGGLTVTKTVTGDAGDTTKEFHFTVTLSDTTVNGTYGNMTFTGGVATFTLKDGESATATGLPAGVEYTVTETEANADGYTTSATGDTGAIPANGTAEAEFINDKPTTTPETGNLTVRKTVTGEGDRTKEFHFTVTLSDTTVNGTYDDMTFTDGVAEFVLKHGESATATGLPANITYTVTETEANLDGYTTSATGDTGTIPANGTAEAAFINDKPTTPPPPPPEEPKTGGLTVTKTVTGEGDRTKEFHFTVTLSDTTVNGTYGGMTFENGVAEFTLTHGQSASASGLPAGTTYTVTETEANQDGYRTTVSGDSGSIPEDGTAYAEFENSMTPGQPHKTETAPGDGQSVRVGDQISYEISWTNNEAQAATVIIRDPLDPGVDFVSAGEGGVYDAASHTVTWTLPDRPSDAAGTVTLTVKVTMRALEDDKTVENQAFVRVGNQPEVETEIPENPVKETGNLTVTKTVTGDAGDTERYFTFTVTLSDETVEGTYGGMTFTGGVAQFHLKSGESRTAVGLPAGIAYTVVEAEADAEGYVTEKTGDAGTIQANDTANADFVNSKETPPPEPGEGALTVTKTVSGNAVSNMTAFHFTVTLDNAEISGTYGDMTFENGVAEFTLRHGQSRTATGLPAGTGYTVTEAEAGTQGYRTAVTGAEGAIPDGDTAQAAFENYRHVPVEEPKPGPLAVRKLVTGEGGDTEKEFTFRVTLDTPLNGAYGEMEFVNGVATFTLRSGEVKWGREIPSGTGFTVEELEANQDGYDTIAQGTVGTIGDVRSEVRFQNHKGLWEPEDEEPWEELEDPEVPLTDLPTDEIPATGDSTRLGFWLVMLILSLTGTAITSALLITQKRLVSLDGKHITK